MPRILERDGAETEIRERIANRGRGETGSLDGKKASYSSFDDHVAVYGSDSDRSFLKLTERLLPFRSLDLSANS